MTENGFRKKIQSAMRKSTNNPIHAAHKVWHRRRKNSIAKKSRKRNRG